MNESNADSLTKKKVALVTGASRGIGLSISKLLISKGYTVIGLCRTPEKVQFVDSNFTLVKCDLTNLKDIQNLPQKIQNWKEIELLVSNAGIGYFSPIDEMKLENITELVNIHLTAPMCLVRLLTKQIKESKGRMIFIGSVAGEEISPWGNIYGGVKAGLHHFVREIYSELRKYEVKVHLIIPDMINTEFYNQLNISPDEDPRSYLEPNDISNLVLTILNAGENVNLFEMKIAPKLFKIKRRGL